MESAKVAASIMLGVFEMFWFPNVGFLAPCVLAFLFGLALGNTPIGIPVFGREHAKAIGITGAGLIIVAVVVTMASGHEVSPGLVLLATSFFAGMIAIARMNGYIRSGG